ncbi:MAG TPA: chloride channel core, partial [Hyphomonadaceae bacterium]|nr:chloride channel core [Hyphomonadaceae bacterium]
MGAVLSGFFAHRFNLTPAQIRALLGCGAAAAVASSFNAPLAGLLFAHEVVLGRYRTSDIGPI